MGRPPPNVQHNLSVQLSWIEKSSFKVKRENFHSEFPEICLAVNSGRKTEMDDLDFSGELWEVWEVGPSGSNKTSGGEV